MPIQDGAGRYDPTGAVAKVSDAAQNNPTIINPLVIPLVLILRFIKLLLQASASLFGWVVTPENQTAVMGQPVIYQTWMMVRDLLNVAFILVLLFSAFSTIFQVEKYSYKKLLLNLVLMALLVNFSFPIARVIIDTSNVLMYSLINRMTFTAGDVVNGGPKTALGAIAFGSKFADMLNPQNYDVTYLISAIVFGFILAITLLAIGVMFIIRMVALAILIIFSPIAFVASILPDTSSYSSKWWSNLFKYAFFGPIMIFMLYISSSLIVQMGSTPTMKKFQDQAINQTSASSDVGIIAAISYYSIPIVILWFGMGMAQSMGVAGAGTVMGYAQKVSQSAGKRASGYSWAKKQYDDYASIKKKEKEDDLKHTPHFVDRALAKLGNTKAKERVNKKHKDKNKDAIDKGAKDLVDAGASTDTLASDINQDFKNPSSDKIETAKRAKAYTQQDSDERKMHIQNTLERAGGIEGSDLEHIINESGKGLKDTAKKKHEQDQANVRRAAEAVATNRKNGRKIDENDIRIISGFINKQMRLKIEEGANVAVAGRSISPVLSRSDETKPPVKPVKLATTPEEKILREVRADQEGNRQGNNRSELGNFS